MLSDQDIVDWTAVTLLQSLKNDLTSTAAGVLKKMEHIHSDLLL